MTDCATETGVGHATPLADDAQAVELRPVLGAVTAATELVDVVVLLRRALLLKWDASASRAAL